MAKPRKKIWMARVCKEFNDDLTEIKRNRIALKKDDPNKKIGNERITLAFHRHPLTKTIWKDIINADLE